jgi:hypothetical protein
MAVPVPDERVEHSHNQVLLARQLHGEPGEERRLAAEERMPRPGRCRHQNPLLRRRTEGLPVDVSVWPAGQHPVERRVARDDRARHRFGTGSGQRQQLVVSGEGQRSRHDPAVTHQTVTAQAAPARISGRPDLGAEAARTMRHHDDRAVQFRRTPVTCGEHKIEPRVHRLLPRDDQTAEPAHILVDPRPPASRRRRGPHHLHPEVALQDG